MALVSEDNSAPPAPATKRNDSNVASKLSGLQKRKIQRPGAKSSKSSPLQKKTKPRSTDSNMYINSEQLDGFSAYKYNCVDNSPISKYVMHPFWNWCVQFVPRSIAPNVLTITGFMFTILQYVLLAIYDPTFNAQTAERLTHNIERRSPEPAPGGIGNRGLPGTAIPSFIWFICSFSQFMAHTLDGIDGKQARRIGLTGPLGELMDHGIDAWSCSFIAMSIFSTIGVSSDPSDGITMVDMFVSLWLLQLVFYVAHWEKFVTGVLYLPWTYDLSMIALCFLYIYVGIFGSSFWTKELLTSSPLPFKFTILNLLRTAFLITSVIAILQSVFKVIQAKRNGKATRSFMEICTPWISMILAITVFALWTFAGPYPQSINGYHPRSVLVANGVIFANIVARLIVCQMSHSPPRPVIHPFIVVVAGFFILDKFIIHHAYITTILWPVCAIVLVLLQLHFAIMVTSILARHFNIFALSTAKRASLQKDQ